VNTLATDIHNFITTGAVNYYYGVGLLDQVCKNRSLLMSLRRKISDFNIEKLKYELEKYLTSINYVQESKELQENAVVQKTIDVGAKRESFSKHEQTATVSKPQMDGLDRHTNISSHLINSVQSRISEWTTARNSLYALRDSYHGELHAAQTDERRYELACLIQPIQGQVDEYNRKIKEIKQTNTLPENEVKNELTAKQFARLQHVKIYINRYKVKANKANTVEKREHYTAKMESFITEKQEILNNV